MKYLISGKRICLRKIKISDATGDYLRWMNDKKVTRYLAGNFKKYSISDLKTYIRNVSKDKAYLFLAIMTSHDEHIGNIKIGPINLTHKYADIGIIIGEKSFWGRGFATEALKLAVSYAFRQIKLHKLIAGAYVDNKASIKIFKKCGFKHEGTSRKKFLCNGCYVDSIELGLISKEAGQRRK